MCWKLPTEIHCCNATAQESEHLPQEGRCYVISVFAGCRSEFRGNTPCMMSSEVQKASLDWHLARQLSSCMSRFRTHASSWNHAPGRGIFVSWAENFVEDMCASATHFSTGIVLLVLLSNPRFGFSEKEKCTNSETPYQTKLPTQNFPKGRSNKKMI